MALGALVGLLHVNPADFGKQCDGTLGMMPVGTGVVDGLTRGGKEMQRRTALLLASVAAMSCPSAGWAGAGLGKPGNPILLGALSSMRFNVDSVDTEPINGFIPQVVMGLTNENNNDDEYSGVEGFGIASSSPGGLALPTTGGSPVYVVATLDAGSSGDIVSYDSAQAFDFTDAGLVDGGSQTTTISGASGDEDVTITNALGVYATDFSHASVNGGALTVSSGSLQGQYNVPILVGNQGDGLPNIIGSPILAQYRATIQNSVPQHLNVGGVVYQTPKVTLGAFSTTIPTGYSKLTLKAYDSLGEGPETENSPYYINYNVLEGGEGGPVDPSTPGIWASFFTNGGVGISRNGTSASGQTFLLDTGAQVSVISNDEAASVGIFNASPATADFTEQVQGVGGITEVPGYFLNTLTLTTQGGVMTWNRVPVLVLDVADPRDPTSALPGILGTSLFSDRDLILNANVGTTAQTYLAIGPQMQWQNTSGGNWSTSGNWAVVLPNGIDMQANFYGAITAPATVNVDSAFTVGRITFDNANRYTLSGSGSITLSDSADASQINVRTGSHTIATPVTLASDTTITVIPTTSTLTMSGIISSSGSYGIIESGFGTVLLSNANTYTGDTNVTSGTLTITGSINSINVTTAIGAILNASGTVNAGLSKSTVLNSDGVVNIFPSTSGLAAVTLASIEVGSDPTSKVTVLPPSLHANRTVLITSSLTFPGTTDAWQGQLDLTGNDAIIHGGNLATITNQIKSGYAVGSFTGTGITSSTAGTDPTHRNTLGVLLNSDGHGHVLYSTFDNQSVGLADVLVKYTYYGDADLSGKVDGNDYTLIDSGYGSHGSKTGWQNGDFNYDGSIDGSDYSLIDNTFNSQSATGLVEIATQMASSTAEIASPTSVPEPASVGLLGIGSIAFLKRRRISGDRGSNM
jgi:autotransporter-associated beta strand protein